MEIDVNVVEVLVFIGGRIICVTVSFQGNDWQSSIKIKHGGKKNKEKFENLRNTNLYIVNTLVLYCNIFRRISKAEADLRLAPTSKIEHFVIIVNGWKLLQQS